MENPPFSLDPDEWSTLETTLGKPLSDEAKQAVLEICRSYLRWRSAELNAGKTAPVEEGLRKLKHSVEQCHALFTSSFFGTDHALELKRLIERSLKLETLDRDKDEATLGEPEEATFSGEITRIKADRLWRFDEDGLARTYADAEPDLFMSIDIETATSILHTLVVATRKAEEALAGQLKSGGYDSFKSGGAIRDWAENLMRWGEQYGHGEQPYRVVDGDKAPAPLAKFAYELHRKLPKKYREPSSPGAIAARMNRVRRERP